ncbi:THUMP-like domain-containing protein [Marinoscillum sp.]|uniref:THUMP-like domain-containing protein n=1 Tax=Marinoscillum sp. TaxID=2024838 RepID=UPI003BAC4089
MNTNAYIREEVKQFISDNLNADVQKFLLNPPAEFKEHIEFIVDQIISRRKAKTKLPDWYSNRDLIMPPPLSLEQCSSPATSAYKAGLIQGEVLVDLTGGMGVDTLAFAELYQQVHYVEMNKDLYEVFEHNKKVLGKNIATYNLTSEAYLNSFSDKACFFVDPARRDVNKSRVFRFEDCSPNILELLPQFKQKAQQVLVKAAPMIDISLGIKQLDQVREVHVVSLKNEVKEVLFLLDFEREHPNSPIIKCINLESEQSSFEFKKEEELGARSQMGELKKYLYDPNASILKAGAFRLIGNRFDLTKLGTNTHLYTSDQLIDDFPGRVWEVLATEVNKKSIGRILPMDIANVITKNHPQKPEELKKKLKIKDGGEYFVIGFRDLKDRAQLCIAKPAS